MADFFYPYRDAQDALGHLGPYADHAVGQGCGVTFSDGRQVTVLRRPAGGQQLWLNVWRRHVTSPHPAPAPPPQSGIWHSTVQFFEHAIEMYGEQQVQQAQMEAAAMQPVANFVDNNVWQPAHAWLLKHKLWADAIGVAADVVGVVAGVVVICVAGPEVALGAAIVGGVAILGSLVLTAIDGTVLGYEIAGNEDKVKAIEGNDGVQWARIIATAMTLPDMAVGGVQAVRDITKLPSEVEEANALRRTLTDAAEAQRARAAKIAHPAKHVHKVQQRLSRANRLAAQATKQAELAAHRSLQLRAAKLGVVGSYGATPTGAGLMVGAPPDVLLTEQQKRRDEETRASLTPAGGMPKDVRFDMRVSGVTRTPHP